MPNKNENVSTLRALLPSMENLMTILEEVFTNELKMYSLSGYLMKMEA